MSKIAFIFPGQGSQYVGMGVSLCKKYPVAQKIFQEASDVCGYDLLDFCARATYKKLLNSEKSLPALLTVSVAIFYVFREWISLEAKYFAGYSFGELTALVCSKSIDFRDALKIALYKSEQIKNTTVKTKSAMTSIDGLESQEVEKICIALSKKNSFIKVGIYNSKENTVVSGDCGLVEKLEENLKCRNILFNRLEMKAPFHTPYFKKSSFEIGKEMMKYQIKKPLTPVLSSVTVSLLGSKEEIIESVSGHFCQPVQWSKTMDYLLSKKIEIVIEIGPKKIVSSLLAKDGRMKEVYSFSDPRDFPVIKERFILDKEEILSIMTKCIRELVSVRNLNENDTEYYRIVTEPYRKIKNKIDFYRLDENYPENKDVVDSFVMLKNGLIGKLLKKSEIELILKVLYDEHKKLSYITELDDIWKIKK